jgi:hypothetical protein
MHIKFLSGKRSFSPSFSLIVSFCFFLTLYPASKIRAQGNLLVAPKRAVFEGRDRYKELTLSNTGKDTARYDISFKHYRMKENGALEELSVPDPGTQFADSFVRFFPRTVTLAPGEAQVVRIQLTQIGKIVEGEYRSHLYFRSVPKSKPLGEKETKTADSSSITIKLNAIFGIAVPIIIRVGETTTKIGVTNCSFEKADAPFVKMTLNRTGNMSCYGDITVDYISPSGTATRVVEQKGLAIYTPIEQRQVRILLPTKAGLDYTKGKLHVVYKAQENLNQNSIGQMEIHLN